MHVKNALIAELLEFGQWFTYGEYYDLYNMGDESDPRKKGLYVADFIRRWKDREEKETGERPVLAQRKKRIPKEFSRKRFVEGMQRNSVTLNDEGDVVSERYGKIPEENGFDPVREEWEPVFTTLDTRNDRQWIRFRKPVDGFSEKEKMEFLDRKDQIESSKLVTHYSPPKKSNIEKWLLIGCIHVPWHNKWLFDGVFKMMSDEKFDGVVFGGDTLDMMSLGKHSKGEAVPYTLWEEYLEGVKLRKNIDSLMPDNAEKIWLNGNHEDRYYRFLKDIDNSKLGAALVGIDKGVGLSENSWKYLPNWLEDKVTINDCDIIHGQYLGKHPWVRHCEVSSVIGRDVVFYHSHRFGMFTNGIRTAYNLGTMADIDSDGFKYVSPHTRQGWGNGFGVLIKDGSKNHIQPVRCTKRNFFYNGKKY